MTTPTFAPGDRVRARADAAGLWIDGKLALRVKKRVAATVLDVYGTVLPPHRREYRVRFDPIRKSDIGLTDWIVACDLEPCPMKRTVR